MRLAILMYFFGLLAFAFLPKFVLAILVLFLIFLFLLFNNHRLKILFFLFAIIWLWLFYKVNSNYVLDQKYNQQSVMVAGVVEGLPIQSQFGTRFILATNQLSQNGKTIPFKGNLELTWPSQFAKPIAPGDDWFLKIKLKTLHVDHNPGATDFSIWYLENRIAGIGTVQFTNQNRLLKQHSLKLDSIRNNIKNQLKKSISSSDLYGLILALVIGDESSITQAQWDVLSKTGTNHLVVIAGLHIALCTGFIYFVVFWCWRLVPFFCLYVPAKQAGITASLLIAIVYAALAGFSLPTTRALLMLICFLSSQLSCQSKPAYHSFFLTLFVLLLFDPMAILSNHFWLSFGSIALILLTVSSLPFFVKAWRRLGGIQFSLALGLLPWTLFFFQKASLISALANMIAIPWFGFLVEPLCLLGTLFIFINQTIANTLLSFACDVLKYIWVLLIWLSHFKWSFILQDLSNPMLMIFASLGCTIILLPQALRLILPAWMLLLPLLFPPFPNVLQNEFVFTVLAVGQGLATVIQTQHHVLVYDTGPKFSPGQDAATRYLIPYLLFAHAKQVDMLIVSHPDADHSGGANSLLNTLPVKVFITSDLSKVHYVMKPKICLAGQHWLWDGVLFQIIYPDKSHLNQDNNSSCVLKVSVGKQAVLLPGDIETSAEKIILADHVNLNSRVLIAPHHGSQTSSSMPFIQAIHPNDVIFATGFDNRFGFPNAAIVNRYNQLGVKELDTKNTGAVIFRITKEKILLPILYNQKLWYFWDN